MRSHAGLLAVICQSPDRDDLRLMLADWLDENGEEDHAEFIRVQCKLAKHEAAVRTRGTSFPAPSMPEGFLLFSTRNTLRRREQQLLIAHPGNPAWLNLDIASHPHRMLLEGRPGIYAHGLGVKPMEFEFHRGFVLHVTCDTASWLIHGPRLVQCQPVEKVTLTTPLSIRFGPVNEREENSTVETILMATWDVYTQGHPAMRCALKMAVGKFEFLRLNGNYTMDEFRHRIDNARTPLGYLHARWPRIGFVLPQR